MGETDWGETWVLFWWVGPCSVQFSHSVVSISLQPHGLQHARPPCPSPNPRVDSNSCPLCWWCHPTISCSVVHFSFCLPSFPASGSFQMSQLFASGGQSIGISASASVLPMNIQNWFPLGWTGWISLQFSKSLIQFPADGWGCVPSLLLDLRPNYGGGNENNGDPLQKVPCMHCYTQCLRPWSRPLLTHNSTRDSWTLMDMSGSVSCGVTAPFSWVLVHTRFCLCPPRVCSPVLFKFWWFYGEVDGDLLQEGLSRT